MASGVHLTAVNDACSVYGLDRLVGDRSSSKKENMMNGWMGGPDGWAEGCGFGQ